MKDVRKFSTNTILFYTRDLSIHGSMKLSQSILCDQFLLQLCWNIWKITCLRHCQSFILNHWILSIQKQLCAIFLLITLVKFLQFEWICTKLVLLCFHFYRMHHLLSLIIHTYMSNALHIVLKIWSATKINFFPILTIHFNF